MRHLAVALVACLALTGCELLVSDSASRTAFALREGARRLAGSADTTLTVHVTPREWPDGCKAEYRLDFAPDSAAVPGLAVRCLPSGPVYTSGSAIPLVATDSALSVQVPASAPVHILLHKSGSRIRVEGFTDGT